MGLRKQDSVIDGRRVRVAVRSAFLLIALGSCECAPSEAALNRAFKEHRRDLETVVRLAREDAQYERIWSWYADSLSRHVSLMSGARLAQYDGYFKATGVTFVEHLSNGYHLRIWSSLDFPHGRSRGLAYLPDVPARLATSCREI